jgi:anti-sigma B factor antagonist
VQARRAVAANERVVDGVTVLDLKGKMTLGEGDELLKDKINSLIQQDRKKLLLNLEGVPYIDSAGLGEIVRTYTTVSRQGGKLKLLNLTKRIQDLLAITKLLTAKMPMWLQNSVRPTSASPPGLRASARMTSLSTA